MRRLPLQHRKNTNCSGQYMVEFGMTFVFFIFVILASINMLAAAYNYNAAQRACWEATRKAATGGTDTEVLNVLWEGFTNKMIGTTLMQTKLDKNANNIIDPPLLLNRVEGAPVTVSIDYTLGLSLGIFPMITVPFKVESTLAVIAENDIDRDGLNDQARDNINAMDRSLERAYGFFESDFDNDGVTDSLETDFDNDGVLNDNDWGIIYLDTGTSTFMLDHTTMAPTAFGSIAGGYFMSRQFYVTTFGERMYFPYPFRPQMIPRERSTNPNLAIYIDMRHDADNDGWETRWDINDANVAWGSGRNTVNL